MLLQLLLLLRTTIATIATITADKSTPLLHTPAANTVLYFYIKKCITITTITITTYVL